jgi:hypothetical protein|tara:strand:+ start:557 stop:736 length:180 start_codon:yes stop_codon:yes gene_type:complete
VNDNQKIMQWLNQTINGLKETEEKEFIFSSEYAGRKVNIRIKIDAINKSSEASNRISSS